MNNFKLLVLGGGITGLAIAESALKKGIPTALVEASLTGQKTSTNTLRIIHGGFRYLQNLNLPRVLRSLHDQNYVATTYPTETTRLPCLMPLTQRGLKSRYPVALASKLYGALMRLRSSPLPVPTILSPKELEAISPHLPLDAPYGALSWHDLVMINPQGITDTLVTSITQLDGTLLTNTIAESIRPAPGGYEVLTTTGEVLQTKTLVNTLGPWIHSLQTPETLQQSHYMWCRGINIIVKKQLHPTHAIGLQSREGILFFCVPRGDHTAIGTWYVPCPAPTLEEVKNSTQHTKQHGVSEETIRLFINSFNRTSPHYNISEDDILSIDTGILPMKENRTTGPNLYGDAIITNQNGYIEVVSTKYTTFHSQAASIVKLLTS